MKGSWGIQLASFTVTIRSAVPTGIRIVRVIVQSVDTDFAAITVTSRGAIYAPIFRLWLEHADPLGS